MGVPVSLPNHGASPHGYPRVLVGVVGICPAVWGFRRGCSNPFGQRTLTHQPERCGRWCSFSECTSVGRTGDHWRRGPRTSLEGQEWRRRVPRERKSTQPTHGRTGLRPNCYRTIRKRWLGREASVTDVSSASGPWGAGVVLDGATAAPRQDRPATTATPTAPCSRGRPRC